MKSRVLVQLTATDRAAGRQLDRLILMKQVLHFQMGYSEACGCLTASKAQSQDSWIFLH